MSYDRSPEYNQDAETQVLAPVANEADESLIQLTRGEIDMQIRTAKQYPRSLTLFRKDATDLVTADPQTADECIYALPRGGKTLEGPSVRFAEILAYCWGNNRSGARPMQEGDEFISAQGVFFDLQTNVAVTLEVKRRITDAKGNRYNSDMIGTTSNAVNSIARRDAILGGIPKSFWRPIYNAARQVVAGDVKTLANRRAEALKTFTRFGIKPEQIFSMLEVNGIEEVTGDHLVTLRGVLTAIRDGAVTPEQAFAPKDTRDQRLAEKSKAGVEAIKERYAKASEPQPQAVPSPSVATEPVQASEIGVAPGPQPAPGTAEAEPELPPDEFLPEPAAEQPPAPPVEVQGLPGLFNKESAHRPVSRHRDEG